MIAKLNQPDQVFQYIEQIKRNVEQFALLRVMNPLMIDYAGVNP